MNAEAVHSVDIWYEAAGIGQATIDAEVAAREAARAEFLSVRAGGEIRSIAEAWEANPHRFFIFAIDDVLYCGRKLISPLVTNEGSPGLFCSIIRPEMLLGVLINWQTSQAGVRLSYRTLSSDGARAAFARVIADRLIDIAFPFAHLNQTDRLEVNTPPEGWFVTPERAEILGKGERHLRALSARIVAESGVRAPVVYDPACSTGQFLAEIKRACPRAFTIGQDLSEAMCAMAEAKVDRLYRGDSATPGPAAGSCDFIFFRFLNAEVVTRSRAACLFDRIARCLKPAGRLILFGHTPVLLSIEDLRERGFAARTCTATLDDRRGVFQYYDLTRTQR